MAKNVSLSITDLCDVDGFEDEPSPDKVYGLQHTYGTYKRTEIKPPKLNELEDVDGFAEGVENKMYGLKFTGNKYVQEEIKFPPLNSIVDNHMGKPYERMSIFKDGDGNWFAMPKIPWILNLCTNSGFVANLEDRIFNRGIALGTFRLFNVNLETKFDFLKNLLVRSSNLENDIAEIVLNGSPNVLDYYWVTISRGINSFSLYIKVYLGEPQDTFIKILQGVEIKWNKQAAEKFCRICINSEGADVEHVEGVVIRLENDLEIQKLFVYENLSWYKFKYINKYIPMKYLKACG